MTHDEMIAVITHHKNGGKVEWSYKGQDIWLHAEDPCWDFENCKFRPKPEPMAIYAEVSTINGQVLRTSTRLLLHENDNTIIKKFIEV